jgi:multisubunit Na+/H+ antiporter MnhB subunit
MTPSVILQTTARLLVGLLILFAVSMFFRGHNAPGGGFIAGLGVTTAVVLYAVAFGPEAALRFLRVDPLQLAGAGLLVAIGSGLVAIFRAETFMAGQWFAVDLAGAPELKLGTPLLFDLGVMMVVIGIGVAILIELSTERRDD